MHGVLRISVCVRVYVCVLEGFGRQNPHGAITDFGAAAATAAAVAVPDAVVLAAAAAAAAVTLPLRGGICTVEHALV